VRSNSVFPQGAQHCHVQQNFGVGYFTGQTKNHYTLLTVTGSWNKKLREMLASDFDHLGIQIFFGVWFCCFLEVLQAGRIIAESSYLKTSNTDSPCNYVQVINQKQCVSVVFIGIMKSSESINSCMRTSESDFFTPCQLFSSKGT